MLPWWLWIKNICTEEIASRTAVTLTQVCTTVDTQSGTLLQWILMHFNFSSPKQALLYFTKMWNTFLPLRHPRSSFLHVKPSNSFHIKMLSSYMRVNMRKNQKPHPSSLKPNGKTILSLFWSRCAAYLLQYTDQCSDQYDRTSIRLNLMSLVTR